MSLRVEEWPVADHMDLWHSLLAQTRDTPIDQRTLAWRYLENPHGVARAWVLVDDVSRDVGGFTVVMPRRMRLEQRELVAWIGADFSILPRFRALGPALQLRRAAREAIDAGAADLLYSFPNERMQLIHERAGHARLGELRRYAYPVSLRAHLGRLLASPSAARVLAPPAEFLRRLSWRVRSAFRSDTVALQPNGVVDERLTAADARAGNRLRGVRDRAYLEWRYSRQPGWRGGMLAAMRKQRYTGYLVFTLESELLHISDLAAIDDAAAGALITKAVLIAVRRGCVSVSFAALERGLWEDVLTRIGLRQREEHYAVYAYVPDRHRPLLDARDPARWHLTVGDRDI